MFEESLLTCDEIWVDVLLLGKQHLKKQAHSHTAAHAQPWLRVHVMRLMLTHARKQGYQQ
jgi:hypothetical protein